ncbi:MAG TPA: hypothetical protein VFH62_04950, partial [Dehalococcoidia bacterium]|nr:hypothetical protein [Dehalococcoidia bacterium]
MKLVLGIVAGAAAIGVLAVSLLVGFGAEAAPGAPHLTPTRTATPRVTPTATATPIVPRAAEGPGIMVTECSGTGSNSVRVFFLWNPSHAGTQYLDLSVFNNGFA